jgi:hypothetical protein
MELPGCLLPVVEGDVNQSQVISGGTFRFQVADCLSGGHRYVECHAQFAVATSRAVEPKNIVRNPPCVVVMEALCGPRNQGGETATLTQEPGGRVLVGGEINSWDAGFEGKQRNR